MSFPLPSEPTPTLADYEFSYGGLTFGGFTGAYQLLDAQGLYDLAGVQSGDGQRPMDQGEFAGVDVMGGRDIVVEVVVIPDSVSFDHARQALSGAFKVRGSKQRPLWFRLPSGLYVTECRPRKFAAPIDAQAIQAQSTNAAVAFHAVDPRVYGAPTRNLLQELTEAEKRVSSTIENRGNEECRPFWVVEGGSTGCKHPSIQNRTLPGEPTLTFNVTLLPGDTLEVDLDFGTAIQISGSTVTDVTVDKAASSVWWTLEPGPSLIGFNTADVVLPKCRSNLRYADAFVGA